MAMFEQEIEMEKRNSSVVPLLLILTLIFAVLGVAGYYLMESRKVLTEAQASQIATAALEMQGPATVRIHVGMVKGSIDDRPHDPHYRLLEKAGVIKMGKDTGAYGTITPVMLTPMGQKLLEEVGAEKSKEKDGIELYVIPLAQRKLVSVSHLNTITPSRATFEYTWKWEPNKLGNLFDASGSLVKEFNTWDRATLIQKYGADFYHGDATGVTLSLVKGEQGWQLSTE
jgi:hypothetical protein